MADLEEMKATGENSENMDPVVGAGGAVKKRKADLFKTDETGKADNIEKNVKTPQGSNNAGLHEMLTAVFGAELSEDFKGKAETLWEAAIHERAEEIRAELSEEMEEALNEQVQEIVAEMTDKLDSYLDYVVENWMEENAVALEAGYKVSVAESLIAGLKALAEDHAIDIEDSEVDVVAAIEEEKAEIAEKYNGAVEEVLALREACENLQRELAFVTISEGMVATDVERFKVLSEGITFDGAEDFAKKLETIKESYFTESVTSPVDQAEMLEEEVEVAKTPAIEPSVAAYVATLNRFSQNQ